MSIAMDRASMLLGSARAEVLPKSWSARCLVPKADQPNCLPNQQQSKSATTCAVTRLPDYKATAITDISLEQLRYAQILIDVMKNDFQKGDAFAHLLINWLLCRMMKNSLNVHFDNIQAEQAEGLEVPSTNYSRSTSFHLASTSSVIQFKSEQTRRII